MVNPCRPIRAGFASLLDGAASNDAEVHSSSAHKEPITAGAEEQATPAMSPPKSMVHTDATIKDVQDKVKHLMKMAEVRQRCRLHTSGFEHVGLTPRFESAWFQLLESEVLSSHWFQMLTCTPTPRSCCRPARRTKAREEAGAREGR